MTPLYHFYSFFMLHKKSKSCSPWPNLDSDWYVTSNALISNFLYLAPQYQFSLNPLPKGKVLKYLFSLFNQQPIVVITQILVTHCRENSSWNAIKIWTITCLGYKWSKDQIKLLRLFKWKYNKNLSLLQTYPIILEAHKKFLLIFHYIRLEQSPKTTKPYCLLQSTNIANSL